MALLDGVDPAQLSDRGLMHATFAAVQRLESQMSQMNEALGRLSTAVTEQRDKLQGQIDTLLETLEAERQAATALAEAETAEDVGQEAALADARAATDAAVNELQGGVDAVNQLADRVAEVQGEQPPTPEPLPEPAPEPLPEDPSSETPVDPSVPPSDQPVQ